MNKTLFTVGPVMIIMMVAIAGCTVKLVNENEACGVKKACVEGLKCVKGVCSSGEEGATCLNYKDCNSGLYCIKAVCSQPPSYKKYFNKITISKMKQGIPPGPNNIPVPTTNFKVTDAIEVDVIGLKEAAGGMFYYELINSVTGETEMSSVDYKQKVMQGGWGTGFAIPGGTTGDFDLNIYFNDQLIYTVPITISQ